MEEKTLVLEGLPGDFELVRPKLELYFKNKRKSGGEVVQIKEHAEDKRKALLIYLLETDFNNVLKQEVHKIDFKSLGVVKLTVKSLNVKKEKVKPPIWPRPKIENLEHVKAAQATSAQRPNLFLFSFFAFCLNYEKASAKVQKGNEEDSKTKDLLISCKESVDKDILTVYFEQFTDKAEITKYGKNKWILKVANHSDVLMILSQKKHEFGLTVELYKDAVSAEQWDPRRFILSGFKDSCKCKLITMFIGSCSQKASHTWEVIDDERIVVTFNEDIDSKLFLEKCAAKNLQGMEIEASYLEFTDSVLVQGDMSKITEDTLMLYFSNKRSSGADIKSFIWVNKQKSVVISFQDCHVAQEVVKLKHHLCGTDLSTSLFYSSLQKALTGETPTCPNIATNIIIPVNEVLRNFIEKNQKCKNDFKIRLKEVHANVIFDKTMSPGEIALEMAVDKESLAAVRLGATWESKAQREAQAFLSRYSIDELPVEVEIWKRVEHDCLGFVSSDAEVTYMESKSKIAVVGLKPDVTTLIDKIRNLVKNATSELELKRNTVEKVIQFDSRQTLELVEKCVQAKLQNVILTKSETNLTFHLQDPTIFILLIYHQKFYNVKASVTPTNTTSQDQTKTLKQASDTEVTVHGVLVFLKKGDITKETVDVIVNSNNKALDLDTGVSGAILKAAGQSVVDECKKHGQQKENGVVLTSGGKLSCKHIAQMVGPKNVADITSSVEKVLKLCEDTKAATVAIPAIGTGRGGIGANDSIKAILAGVQNHLSQSTSSSLQKITVVAFEQKIFYAYCNYFRERNSTTAPTKVPANKVKIAGVWIELKKGNITNESVRGIVNTTNNQMNLTGGVSGAIFGAAGPSVQQECQKHGPLQSDTVAVTSAGNLQCDFIIHIMGPHSSAEARLRVMKVLERCEEKQISTISFPAVGTGGGGVSSMDAMTAMLQGFHDHLSQRSSTVLKLIYVVIDRDEVLKEFQKGLNQWASNSQDIDVTKDEDEDEGEYYYGSDEESFSSEEENVCSGNIKEAIIGPIKVKVLCGDITKDTTDAIVSSTNTTLNLSSGVSGAILKAAGQTVVDECKKLGAQPSDGVVLTTAGKLPFKHIIHMVGQTKEKEITNCMYKVLKKCEENKIQSVSFPALGTGAGNLAAATVANAMIDAVANFSIDAAVFLKTVHIVIFQHTMVSDFEDAIMKFKRISRKPSAATIPKPSMSDTTKSSYCLAAETAAVTFPVTNVELYGTSSTEIAKVKKFLDDLVSDECTSKDVQSEFIANLPEADKKAIVALSQTNQVRVEMVSKDKMIVSGKKDDVLDTVLNINKFLQEARDREIREGEERRLSKTLHWDVAKGETWQPLTSSISYELELAFHKKKDKYTYQDKGETFTVDFKEMKQVNSKGKTCKVKRTLLADSDTAVIQPPPAWSKMDGNDLETVVLSPNSEEYKKIESDFLQSSQHKDIPPLQVTQIRRIQSQSQWQRYCVLKQAVDRKYPKQKNEQFLYHGTTKDICQKINKNGFNRSFCGRNAVVHGDGTYFAKEAWYSCYDQYSNPDENGLKYIYRARVVTGSPCKSRSGMKEPDPLNSKDPRAGLHDCAVDNLQNPFIFVVFCDAGAYPDYLISFKNA
ncbi:hypothetical protein QTP70_031865 [Hemibagrus guttatus]|uniref:Poly [ADP-ribose] polymerase n=1 Tax=Hemibagrus guttatus TaxID=175788 RepID=A0AAE0V886_9TELE|nr:hypothetical protein QTP70_031865 [Hemibagrus guttatus]